MTLIVSVASYKIGKRQAIFSNFGKYKNDLLLPFGPGYLDIESEHQEIPVDTQQQEFGRIDASIFTRRTASGPMF